MAENIKYRMEKILRRWKGDTDSHPQLRQDGCHLLQLPAELRNEIWMHILDGSEDPHDVWGAIPITQTCRQIRQEILSLQVAAGVALETRSPKLSHRLQRTKAWLKSAESTNVLRHLNLVGMHYPRCDCKGVFRGSNGKLVCMRCGSPNVSFLLHRLPPTDASARSPAGQHECKYCRIFNNQAGFNEISESYRAGGLHIQLGDCGIHLVYSIERGLTGPLQNLDHELIKWWVVSLLPELEGLATEDAASRLQWEAVLERLLDFPRASLAMLGNNGRRARKLKTSVTVFKPPMPVGVRAWWLEAGGS